MLRLQTAWITGTKKTSALNRQDQIPSLLDKFVTAKSKISVNLINTFFNHDFLKFNNPIVLQVDGINFMSE